jgi:hypothetical protein
MQSANQSGSGISRKKIFHLRAKFVGAQLSLHATLHTAVLVQALFGLCSAVFDDLNNFDVFILLSHYRLLLLIFVEVSTLVFVFYVANKSFDTSFSDVQLTDLALVFYGLLLPLNNLAFYLFMPSFDISLKNYWPFYIVVSFLGPFLANFTPLYSLAQWALSIPFFL